MNNGGWGSGFESEFLVLVEIEVAEAGRLFVGAVAAALFEETALRGFKLIVFLSLVDINELRP